jgi:hypothetical protein
MSTYISKVHFTSIFRVEEKAFRLFQKIELFTTTAVRTSNPTKYKAVY